MDDYTAGSQPWYVAYNSQIRTVIINDGVTSIGNYAFWSGLGSSNLTSVTIPKSVTSIGDRAFYECSSLTSVDIPDSVISIGDYAFYGCSSLTSVTISNNVARIADSTFSNCSSLTSMTIPGSVIAIEKWAFRDCTNLTSVTISDGVTTIGDWVFGHCNSLTSVTIPHSVNSIGYEAFGDCSSLANVYYSGSKSQWEKIDIKLLNTPLLKATIHYNSTKPDSVYVITFNANGGSVSPTSATTGEDCRLSSLPTPTRDGYTFDGWYTAATGGTRVTAAGYVFTSNTTVYAHWTKKASSSDPTTSTGKDVNDLLNYISNYGASSSGFRYIQETRTVSGTKITATITYRDDIETLIFHCSINSNGNTYTASFDYDCTTSSAKSKILVSMEIFSYSANFDIASYTSGTDLSFSEIVGNIGPFEQPDNYNEIGNLLVRMAVPSWGLLLTNKPGMTLYDIGFISYTDQTDSPTDNPKIAVTGVTLNKTSTTIEAGKTEALTATVVPSNADNKNVTWTSSDSTVATVSNGAVTAVKTGTATITVTTADGGYTATCTVTVTVPASVTYTVTFNSQGGNAIAAQTVANGGKVSKPTDPTRSGYTFGGWFKESACINEWNFDSDIVTGNIMLYAKWTANAPNGETDTYAIWIDPWIRHGEVYTSHTYAEPGTLVTITVYPDADYMVDWVDVERDDGRYLSLSQSGKRYTFTMPASDVTVYASFSLEIDTYEIWVASGIQHGDIYTSHTFAEPGTRVTITVDPDSYYALDWIQAEREDTGRSLTLSRNGSRYTFTMPYSDVVIDAGFSLQFTYTESSPQITSDTIRPPQAPTTAQTTTQPPTSTPTFTSTATVSFSDVQPGSYCYDAVVWAVGNRITTGYGDGTFRPETNCTRADFVTFLWRSMGSPTPSSRTNPFVDVNPNAYYYDAMLWALERGITAGSGTNTFDPNGTCTRAQIVTFLWRANGQPAANGGNTFSDVSTSSYYGQAVAWAVAKGVTAGTTATTFDPDGICTHGQCLTFLYRIMTNHL